MKKWKVEKAKSRRTSENENIYTFGYIMGLIRKEVSRI
jgi:hypothetical protein